MHHFPSQPSRSLGFSLFKRQDKASLKAQSYTAMLGQCYQLPSQLTLSCPSHHLEMFLTFLHVFLFFSIVKKISDMM